VTTPFTKEHDPVLARACVVIPMYNEATVIDDVLRTVTERFGRVVCVDDGSSDESAGLARAAGADVIRHPINLGAGAATLTGIKRAIGDPRNDWIVTLDADGQHSAADAAAMVHAADEAGVQVVFGSRFLGRIEGISARRRRLLKLATRFTRATTGLDVTDAHNGLRVFRRDAASQLKFRLHGMSHASELASQVARNGWSYVEHPTTITYSEYSLAKGQRNYNAINILFDLAMDRLRASA
jgi:polyprenyl-phospho-N-acetylgalactosaminyl synthase